MVTKAPSIEDARVAKTEAKRRLARESGVVGIGLTKLQGRYAVKVNVEKAISTVLPARLGDVAVVVEVVGKILKRQRA